jgi:glycosyltransferase involved in cell wall biosynthesis
MRIAQIAPLTHSVSTEGTDSTHRLIHWLTESLMEGGHEVTLFATGDSVTSARLEAVWPTSVRSVELPEAPLTLQLERAFFSGHSFDVIHSHLDVRAFPCARRSYSPVLTTVHEDAGVPGLRYAYEEFHELPLVSLLKAQRRPLPRANWVATVYPGLPSDRYAFRHGSGRYLAFMDWLCPDTAPLQAIQLAREVGLPLLMAGAIKPAYRDYVSLQINPVLDGSEVAYLGEITGIEKEALLGDALALIVPARHASPAHLSFIEALACGTPIVAMASNTNAEFIEHGVTGFTCQTYQEMVHAIEDVVRLDRCHCRGAFEAKFSVERMTEDYLGLYARVIGNRWSLAAR